jgi:hypothetical protein
MIATLVGPTKGFASANASVSPHGLRSESALDTKTIAAIRRRAALEGCKWDTQVGDVTTLAPFPIVMKRSVWERLAVLAEKLAAEAAAAEEEISHRPELLDPLFVFIRLSGFRGCRSRPGGNISFEVEELAWRTRRSRSFRKANGFR